MTYKYCDKFGLPHQGIFYMTNEWATLPYITVLRPKEIEIRQPVRWRNYS